MAITQSPQPNELTQGPIGCRVGIHLGENVWIFHAAAAPTNGTSGDGAGWAGKGSIYIDRSNAKIYGNTNTKASPTWTVVGSLT